MELETLRVKRCFGLENHITSSRLASGQGREIAEGLAFQEAACARGETNSWKVETPMGLQRVFEPLASTILASGPSRVVKTEWLGILATSR